MMVTEDPKNGLAPIADQTEAALRELAEAGKLTDHQIVVIGTSTSEVLGRHIGTSGTKQVAEAIFAGIQRVRQDVGFFPAFQCCEHLNRALVVERRLLERYPLEEVSVIPVPKAGGAMAAYAFKQLENPAVVEEIAAHAGIDIGNTLIGMHLRKVAVPFRPVQRWIGHALVTMAYSRPKLIGGERAVYALEGEPDSGDCE
jgi:uncharacterized protein (TIGR01440 family)